MGGSLGVAHASNRENLSGNGLVADTGLVCEGFADTGLVCEGLGLDLVEEGVGIVVVVRTVAVGNG